MTVGLARWLIDDCLPREGYADLDILHTSDLSRVPGPAGLREAHNLDRTLVTCVEGFRGPSGSELNHPGVVVFESIPANGAEVARNLRHLEFRISQYEGNLVLVNNRFFVRSDKELFIILADGTELELEPWREVRVQRAPAVAV
jgi:hypothetical protein